jgi:hypothetical protein
MPKHPPIDSAFYEWGSRIGMTDEQINEDWCSYCDDLERFHEETMTAVMGEPSVASHFCVGGLG